MEKSRAKRAVVRGIAAAAALTPFLLALGELLPPFFSLKRLDGLELLRLALVGLSLAVPFALVAFVELRCEARSKLRLALLTALAAWAGDAFVAAQCGYTLAPVAMLASWKESGDLPKLLHEVVALALDDLVVYATHPIQLALPPMIAVVALALARRRLGLLGQCAVVPFVCGALFVPLALVMRSMSKVQVTCIHLPELYCHASCVATFLVTPALPLVARAGDRVEARLLAEKS